jgi:hypothetical protein
MTSPSDYSVRGPDGHPEVAKPVCVSHRDDHLPNPRLRRRSRRRRERRPRPGGGPPPWPAGPPAEEADPHPPKAAGQDHLIDTLA